MQNELHVIFGAGQIGARLARRLVEAGHRVRVVRRSDAPVGVEGVQVVAGDAMDSGFAARAAEGAHRIYHCMNASEYTGRAWEREVPLLGEALIGAALRTGARLVVLDNLYAYGPVEGRLTEATPLAATYRKGAVRARWTERLEAAARESGLRFAVGKAGDFFGEGADRSLVSPEAVGGMLDGERPLALGDLDAPHAFSHVDDVVDGLAALGEADDDVEGSVFHLPVHEVSPRELFARLADALGVDVRPRRLGGLLLRLAWPFASLARELLETLYQWDRPFLVDDSRFRARFPGVGRSLAQAVEDTVRPHRATSSLAAASEAHPAPALGR